MRSAATYVVLTRESPPAASLNVSFHHSVSLAPYDCAAPNNITAMRGRNNTSLAPPLTRSLSILRRLDSFDLRSSSIQLLSELEILDTGTEGAGGAIPERSSARSSKSLFTSSDSSILLLHPG